MNTDQYKEVDDDTPAQTDIDDWQIIWKPLFRQTLVCSGVWALYLATGLCLGAPTVTVPQLRARGPVSDAEASWLASTSGYSSLPWTILVPLGTHYFGRRWIFTLVSLLSFAGFVVFYTSSSVPQLLVGMAMLGVTTAAHMSLSLMILTEYTSPCYRGAFLTIKSATVFWGIWVANAIGTFFHWKYIGMVGIVCCAYSVLVTAVWPESPYWLACRGKILRARESHILLKGSDAESKQELEFLIILAQERLLKDTSEKNYTDMLRKVFSKDFYKPILIAIASASMYYLTGKLVCSIYAIDIIKKITSSESTAYTGMLILDGVTIIGMYCGCALSRYLNRRTLLFATTSTGIAFLFIMSAYLYLIDLSVIVENAYISIMLLMVFSMCISCGPIILSTTLCAELLPLRYRSFGTVVMSFFGNVMLGTTIKVAPQIFSTFKLHGGFLFYGISSTVGLLILVKFLPETKDRTLQEIQKCIIGVDKDADWREGKELIPRPNNREAT